MAFPSDLEIAQQAKPHPISAIGARLGIDPDLLEPYGHFKAKLPLHPDQRAPGLARQADPGHGDQSHPCG